MLLRTFFLTSAMATLSWTFMCPEPYVCICGEIIFNCTCDSRQNITISPIYNFEIRHVLIKGCGTVLIPIGSMFHLYLESVELDDLERLMIHPFALAGLQAVEMLRISNIQHMDVEPRGFSGLYNISMVSISNVTWENMQEESFGGVSSTENFIITDCTFETVESLAFILQNITLFSVENSHFGTVGNMSLLIHGSKEVSFVNCTFQDARQNAFSMSFVELLNFQRCSFDVFASSAIFAKNVGSFAFNDCSVNELEIHAFKNVDILNSIHFTNNVIHLAKENSFYFGIDNNDKDSENREIVISGNKLTCGCDLAWLWESQTAVYKDFIDSSFCIGSSGSLKVVSGSSIITLKSECSSLNITSLQESVEEANDTTGETNQTKIMYIVSSTVGKEYYDFFVVACCCALLMWKQF